MIVQSPRPSDVVNVQVTLDRLPLSTLELRTLSALEVRESFDRATSVTLTFAGRDDFARKPRFVDDDRFQVGAEVAISLGTPLIPVMLGDIVRTRAELSVDGGAHLVLEGYGLRHRLGREPQTRSWEDETDSGIAARIARRHRLVPRVETTLTRYPTVPQVNQTDLEFLTGRAEAIDFDVWVDYDELWFAPLAKRGGPALTLAGSELLGIEATVDTSELLDTIDAPWSDLTAGERGVVTVHAHELGNTLARRLKERWGGRSLWLDGAGATSAEAARKAARARMTQSLDALFVVSASCRGRPDLRVGTRIMLRDLSATLDGELLIVEATHTISNAEYRTAFVGRRAP